MRMEKKMMFKILILQRYYNLSDFQIEYQINDRMSFMRFLTSPMRHLPGLFKPFKMVKQKKWAFVFDS